MEWRGGEKVGGEDSRGNGVTAMKKEREVTLDCWLSRI